MGSYIANFTVYTMAMLGLIFFALFVYKKVMGGGIGGSSSKFLCIEETMNINPRKSLLVVRAGNEKFLVASDVDRTTLISKLGNQSMVPKIEKFEHFENIMQEDLPNIQPVVDEKIEVEQEKEKVEERPTIHLDPIIDKNPNIRRGMDRRVSRKSKSPNPSQTQNQNVVLDFSKPANHGLTTMRKMAKKINEL